MICLLAVWDLLQGWQTDSDRTEQQANVHITESIDLDTHRNILESLLLEGKVAHELLGIVMSADKHHTIFAVIHWVNKKLTHPDSAPAAAKQAQQRFTIPAVSEMISQTALLTLYRCTASLLSLSDCPTLPLDSAPIPVSRHLPVRMVTAVHAVATAAAVTSAVAQASASAATPTPTTTAGSAAAPASSSAAGPGSASAAGSGSASAAAPVTSLAAGPASGLGL